MENSTKAITFNRLPILGKDKVSFEEWNFAFERWCKTNKVEDTEKIEYLISLTTNIAGTIVYNSLCKTVPDDFPTIIKNLREHYRKATSKNTKLLELSTITKRKDETVSEFDVRFNTLYNQIKLDINEQILTSFYINAFRNWSKIYEALLDEEPATLHEAMNITSKKGKIFDLLEENKPKSKPHTTSSRKTIFNNDNKNQLKNSEQISNNYRNSFGNYNNGNQNYKFNNIPYDTRSKNNYNYYNNNNNFTNQRNNTPREQFNQRPIPKRNIESYPRATNEELEEITKKLSELKINFCIQCQRVGHKIEECPELEENHLNY